MRRWWTISASVLAVSVAAASPGVAQGPVDTVIEQLETEGFDVRSVRRTLLGRTRILADSPYGNREVVLNPRNGLVLRDYFERSEDNEEPDENDGEEWEDEDEAHEEDVEDEDEDDHREAEEEDDREDDNGDDDEE